MTVKYAVVREPNKWGNPWGSLLLNPFVWLYHRLMYEQIGGYSLGHEVEFFDTLDEAKLVVNQLYKKSMRTQIHQACAIVEFGRESDNFTVNNIFEFDSIIKFQNKSSEIKWKNRKITNWDLTRGAVSRLNTLEVNHIVKLTSGSSIQPVLVSSSELSAPALANPSKTLLRMINSSIGVSQTELGSQSSSPSGTSSSSESTFSLDLSQTSSEEDRIKQRSKRQSTH